MYGLGARKVALDGLGLLGCTPKELATYGTNGSSCVQFINDEVQIFNDRLRLLVDELNSNLTNANFIYVNTSGILATDPALAGNSVHLVSTSFISCAHDFFCFALLLMSLLI